MNSVPLRSTSRFVARHDRSQIKLMCAIFVPKQRFETHRPHPEVPGLPGLEGRSSARHRSFEAPLRCAPQDEVEDDEYRCVPGPFKQLASN